MKKPEDKAQIWRPSPQPSFEELPLTEKAAILEDNVGWFPRLLIHLVNILYFIDS